MAMAVYLYRSLSDVQPGAKALSGFPSVTAASAACGGARPRGSAPTVHLHMRLDNIPLDVMLLICAHACPAANAAAEGAGSGGHALAPADHPAAASLL